MQYNNSDNQYGVITKFLHWMIFLLYTAQFTLMYRRSYFPDDAPERSQFMWWHKSFGITVLLLALFFIVWHLMSKRPALPSMPRYQVILAKSTHGLLFLSMLVMPVTGYIMSTAGGYKVAFFGLFDLPFLFEKNKAIGSLFHDIHEYSSYAVLALVAVHLFGALYHHCIYKDNVLKRMLPFG